MFYVLEYEPYKKGIFIALLQTFLYTLSAKTMITIGVDVRVSAVFQADGTFELFVQKFLEIFNNGGQREYGYGSVVQCYYGNYGVALIVVLSVFGKCEMC